MKQIKFQFIHLEEAECLELSCKKMNIPYIIVSKMSGIDARILIDTEDITIKQAYKLGQIEERLSQEKYQHSKEIKKMLKPKK